ncbi:AAA family ATPase [Paraburkholderia sp. CNPSo 3272]|uniref:AAA family ATPase n=1 Tax=Paraburkholderia sp. CNPSo 3272 TaxID=2940931 RepID=UPI0020B6495F|nr:AAA family ATPase [Paraburkholderia sp. CNPSo 3272]MCP3722604.1 AAA family ATPase [Paraburkholderia sp. CNPSo 3272]
MKLERFSKIREYRIFKDFTWPRGLEDFGRFNLIYGWNGSGKTTLSSILRAIQTSTSIGEGDVDFVLDGALVSGKKLSGAALPAVRVFNRETVARSVFESSGGSFSQLPPVYVFGEDSAEKQRQMDALKLELPKQTDIAAKASEEEARAQKGVNDYATNTARAIKNLLVAPGGEFNNYNATDFKERMSRFSQAATPELTPKDRETLLSLKNSSPLPSIELRSVNIPDALNLRNDVREALSRTVVSNVIEGLAASPVVGDWVRSGLAIHTHGEDATTCKFCEQPLPANRLRRLEAHFNDEFQRFTRDLQNLAERIENAANQLVRTNLPDIRDLYPELRSDFESEGRTYELNLGNLRHGLLALANTVKQKQARVFEALDLEGLLLGSDGIPAEDKSFLDTFMRILSAGAPALSEFVGKQTFARIEQIVEKHNAKTRSFEEKVKVAREKLHDNEIAVALPEWLEKQKALESATNARVSANDAKAKTEKEIRALEADILKHQEPADELNRELRAYLGHDDIQVAVEATGYRLVRRGSIATNLSDGERTAIAFLYFLKSLQDRSFDLKDGVVVVDDPISSLDSNAIYSAFGFMKRRLCDAGQLFVLTHNYTFLRQVRNWFGHLNRGKAKQGLPARFYMLRASYVGGQRSSAIEAMDPFLRKYESEYHYLFKRIVEASALPGGGPLETYYELPNLARRLLEAFLVFKIPDEDTLHARLEAVDFDGPKKTRILRFLDTHSHNEQIAEGHDDASALSEAPDVLKDLLELIEKCDAGHFGRMRQALTA